MFIVNLIVNEYFFIFAEIRGYDVSMQHQIFSEIMDLDVQKSECTGLVL